MFSPQLLGSLFVQLLSGLQPHHRPSTSSYFSFGKEMFSVHFVTLLAGPLLLLPGALAGSNDHPPMEIDGPWWPSSSDPRTSYPSMTYPTSRPTTGRPPATQGPISPTVRPGTPTINPPNSLDPASWTEDRILVTMVVVGVVGGLALLGTALYWCRRSIYRVCFRRLPASLCCNSQEEERSPDIPLRDRTGRSEDPVDVAFQAQLTHSVSHLRDLYSLYNRSPSEAVATASDLMTHRSPRSRDRRRAEVLGPHRHVPPPVPLGPSARPPRYDENPYRPTVEPLQVASAPCP